MLSSTMGSVSPRSRPITGLRNDGRNPASAESRETMSRAANRLAYQSTARADERRAAAVDDIDRASRHSAAVTRSSIGDGISPFDLPQFDAEAFFEFDTKT